MTIVVRIRFLPNGFGGSVQRSASRTGCEVTELTDSDEGEPDHPYTWGELLILAEHIAKQRRTDDVYRRLLTVSVSGT